MELHCTRPCYTYDLCKQIGMESWPHCISCVMVGTTTKSLRVSILLSVKVISRLDTHLITENKTT
jgi:hypothetical protein